MFLKLKEIMKEEDIKKLGFKFIKNYKHDQYNTNQYAKGVLVVEFTYDHNVLINYDLTVHEVFCKSITLEDLKILTPILGNC